VPLVIQVNFGQVGLPQELRPPELPVPRVEHVNPDPPRKVQRRLAGLVHQPGLEGCPDGASGIAQELEEDGDVAAVAAIVSLLYPTVPTRVVVYPPHVPAGGEGVGVDGLAGGEVLGLLVVYFELEDSRGGIHHGGLRPRCLARAFDADH